MNCKAMIAVLGGGIATFALDGSPAACAGPPADACSLLTAAQVTAVLGVPVAAGEKIMPGSAALCGWTIPGQKSRKGKRVVLSTYTPLRNRTLIERFNAAKAPIPGTTRQPVSGVGDEAMFVIAPALGTGLIFRMGDRAFDLRVHGFPREQIKVKERELADCVIQKLTNGRYAGDCPG
jgi:hypothetical protein